MTRQLLKQVRSGIQLVGLIAAICGGGSRACAELEVSATVQIHAKTEFEAPLSAYGRWVEVGSYGRCWHPVGVAVEWRPYCTGEWVWTDCGWYWQSTEPWGWACYHYGYWVVDPALGWVWVPGIEWAPAWVSWRVGDGFIGWAPLAPPGFFFAARPKPEAFVFVNSSHFGDPMRPSTVIVKDNAIFRRTAEVGGVKRETRSGVGTGSQRVMVNQGPNVQDVQRFTRKAIRPVPVQEAARRTWAASAPKKSPDVVRSKTEARQPRLQAPRESDRKGWENAAGGERSEPVSGGFWQSGDQGGGRGNGGHGRGHG